MEQINLKLIQDMISKLQQGELIIFSEIKSHQPIKHCFLALAEFITLDSINHILNHCQGLIYILINDDNYTNLVSLGLDKLDYPSLSNIGQNYKKIMNKLKNNGLSNVINRIINIDNLEKNNYFNLAIDLARIAQSYPMVIVGLITHDLTQKSSLLQIDTNDIIYYRKFYDQVVERKVISKLPTKFGNFDIYGYVNIITKQDIIVIVKGEPDDYLTPPLVRIHSQCFTGDVFHSLKCDCGEQLEIALNKINQDEAGLIIYLPQEGRGIGLINKLKAYKLQENGLDTYDANLSLGFGPDERDYYEAAQILKDLNLYEIQLITNNPEKINQLTSYGINIVQRVAVKVTSQKYNDNYIVTKQKKFGHF
jgi:GTP cyclohydrolase II